MTDPVLADVERTLPWQAGFIPIQLARPASATIEPDAPARLPADLVTVLRLLERDVLSHDLAARCPLAVALELASEVTAQLQILTQARGLAPPPSDLGTLPALEQVNLLAILVAARLTFDHGQMEGLVAPLRRAIAGALQASEDPVRRIRRTLRAPRRGVCRDYAAMMTTLFYAQRRASLAPGRGFLPAVIGDPVRSDGSLDPSATHVYNLLVCEDTQTLHAVDVTGADWHHEALMEEHRASATELVFELDRVDLSSHRHVSGLLGSIADSWARRGSPLHHRYEAETVFVAALDPHSPRGQVLLLHLSEHVSAPRGAQIAIRAHLTRVGFHRIEPGWDRPARWNRSPLVRALTDDNAWMRLLARLGISA